MYSNLAIVKIASAMAKTAHTIAPKITKLKSATDQIPRGIVLCHVKNGAHYIPHFLKHYRDIGVKRFVFIDNGSTDGGKEFLLSEPDCEVYEYLGPYKGTASGMIWNNIVMSNYLAAPWILNVDIDEFAVYAGWPEIDVDDFVSQCTTRGLSAVTAAMIDMYSKDALANVPRAVQSHNLFQDFDHFDSDSYIRTANSNWRTNGFPRPMINGGISKRLFGGTAQDWNSKTPLLLEPGLVYFDPHTIMPFGLNFFFPLIALLHFRMTGEIVDKVRNVKTLGYAPGSINTYAQLEQAMNKNPDFSFWYAGSKQFKSVSQLLELGLIKAPSDPDLYGN